jgi:hypothetical protein
MRYVYGLSVAITERPLTLQAQEGFASAAFHSFPDTLKWDAYSGDYGPNFLGHALNTGTFLVNYPNFGWQAFGGFVAQANSTQVTFSPRDTLRRRVYIASLGALFTLDAGAFDTVQYTIATKSVTLSIVPAAAGMQAPEGRLLVDQPGAVPGVGFLAPSGTYGRDAGAYVVPFTNGRADVTLRPS